MAGGGEDDVEVPASYKVKKMRARKTRKINAISTYLQHLKAEDVQLLKHNYFKK